MEGHVHSQQDGEGRIDWTEPKTEPVANNAESVEPPPPYSSIEDTGDTTHGSTPPAESDGNQHPGILVNKEKADLEAGINAPDDEGTVKRETWTRNIDFLLACIGFSVGLGNVWRFPYLCYKNGGGAFLIPYFICVVIGGLPLFYLEVAVGQFMSRGGLKCWNIVPMMQGIGLATLVTVFILNCYYNVILTWAFYYLFASLNVMVPWETCDNYWNSEWCTTNYSQTVNGSKFYDPVTEFWENKVLGISGGIEEPGIIKWDLALCLLLAWIVVYCCICKGIKSSGKVMYVTATTPYVFMIVLLIRGVTLDGAVDGIIYYLKPELDKIADIQVWVDAGTQIFFSYSIALGALTALGSYNKFNHNSYRDAIIFTCTNSGTSFLAGFIIFSVLGAMAKEQNVDVKDVAASGPGLTFLAYPKALLEMPISPLWSVFFFIMVILLGLDSQFVGVEGVVTTVVDQYPKLLRKGHRREIFIAIICIIMYFIGLAMCTNGGMYVFQIFDYYGGSKIILLVGFFQCITVSWIYGIRRFYDNIEMMVGFRISPFMMVCWTVLSPVFCLVIFFMSIVNYSKLDYTRPKHPTYNFPAWSVGVGWSMAGLSIISIPIIALYKLFKYTCSAKYATISQVFFLLLKPKGLKPHQLRPEDYGQPSIDDLLNMDGSIGLETGHVAQYKINGTYNKAFMSD